jgi:hypothetical protein
LRASKVKVAVTDESAPIVALAGRVKVKVYVALFAEAPVVAPPLRELQAVPTGEENELYVARPVRAPL